MASWHEKTKCRAKKTWLRIWNYALLSSLYANVFKYLKILCHIFYFRNSVEYLMLRLTVVVYLCVCVFWLFCLRVLPWTHTGALWQRSDSTWIWMRELRTEVAGESDDSAGKDRSIYGDIWLLSPATDMIKWLNLNKCVCLCVWVCLPRSVSHQMDMNNVFIAIPLW